MSEAFRCKAAEAGDVSIVDGGQRRIWALQPAEASRVLLECLIFCGLLFLLKGLDFLLAIQVALSLYDPLRGLFSL